MKPAFYLIIFLLVTSCTSQQKVFWCGDHPCKDKNEKDEYFKKTMIVEVRSQNIDKNKKNESQLNKIFDQARNDQNIKKEKKSILKNLTKNEKNIINEEKKLAKIKKQRKINEEKKLKELAKIKEKKRIKEERELKKLAKIEKKRKLKEEKELEKRILLDEKKMIKKKKILPKKITKNTNVIKKAEENSLSFNKIVDEIINRNSFKPFPDINDIPN